MASKTKRKSSKRISRKNLTMLYLFIAVILVIAIYLLYTAIAPQLASLLASIDGGALSSSANATKTATVNFVYIK